VSENDTAPVQAAPSAATAAGVEPAPRTAIVLRDLPLPAPFDWLRLGLRDFLRAPLIGLFYGGCFMVMGWALLAVYRQAPAYLLALSAGFVLVGPILCLGLYRVSQRLELGERPDFGDSLLAFESRLGPLAIYGLVLLVLEMLWARATMVVFAVSFDGMPSFAGSLVALFDPENLGFLAAWAAVGAVFAGLIYAFSAISIPMLLHRRDSDAITAALTSFRLVLGQPGVMLLWAACLAGGVFVASLPWFAGLLVVGPMLGHASWHAYRQAVEDPTGA
jgi:uncharacterized membrane protein